MTVLGFRSVEMLLFVYDLLTKTYLKVFFLNFIQSFRSCDIYVYVSMFR